MGQTATYSCNTGYNLVRSSTHTCLATGSWSGSAPTCQGVFVVNKSVYIQHRQTIGSGVYKRSFYSLHMKLITELVMYMFK